MIFNNDDDNNSNLIILSQDINIQLTHLLYTKYLNSFLNKKFILNESLFGNNPLGLYLSPELDWLKKLN